MSSSREHWQTVYAKRQPTQVSWFEAYPRISLELLDSLELDRSTPVIDVGAGASQLASELLGRGFTDVTVADISASALERARGDLGPRAKSVAWEQADVRGHDFGRKFGLWHDRAVFHFMVHPEDAGAYLDSARASIAPGGHVIVATFGPDGPTTCSGLPVRRYSASELAEAFGSDFSLAASREVEHRTPTGGAQQFVYAHLRRHSGHAPPPARI